MPELLKVTITREELDRGVLPINHVLCKQYYFSEGAKTLSGIIYGVHPELTYQDADNLNDDSSHVADLAETGLIVEKVPDRLFYDPEDDRSMPWETEMELVEGDFVWTNPIDALNAVTLVCEGEIYKIIPYQDLYVAKREIWKNKWEGTKTTVIVPLNGYCLLKQIYYPKLSPLDITSEEKVDKTKGEVVYFGEPNKKYKNERYTDFTDLRTGDVVLLDKKATPFLLERVKHAARFDSDNLYWVVQRRGIAMVIGRK